VQIVPLKSEDNLAKLDNCQREHSESYPTERNDSDQACNSKSGHVRERSSQIDTFRDIKPISLNTFGCYSQAAIDIIHQYKQMKPIFLVEKTSRN
jgi:hypothetical protein